MLGRSIVRVSQVLRCSVFTEVAEESSVKLITLMNMLFGFNRVDNSIYMTAGIRGNQRYL